MRSKGVVLAIDEVGQLDWPRGRRTFGLGRRPLYRDVLDRSSLSIEGPRRNVTFAPLSWPLTTRRAFTENHIPSRRF